MIYARNKAFDLGLFPEYRCSIPVVCVGNATAGGSGKSPLTHMLAEELLVRGKRPAILSRGYGGKLRGPHLVTSSDSPEDVGDESLMHRSSLDEKVSVVIARKRAIGARYIAENNLGDIVILDDGFQHRWLARDINLLLLDISDESRKQMWKKGKLLPEGRLRETLASALKRATAVMLVRRGEVAVGSNSDDSQQTEGARPEGFYRASGEEIPCFELALIPSHFSDLYSKEKVALDYFDKRTCSAVTAIAYPESFFSILEKRGISLYSKHSFVDHHLFSWQDWQTISDQGVIFTTTKDAVKLRPFVKEAGNVFVLHLKPHISSPSNINQDTELDAREAFFTLIEKKLSSS